MGRMDIFCSADLLMQLTLFSFFIEKDEEDAVPRTCLGGYSHSGPDCVYVVINSRTNEATVERCWLSLSLSLSLSYSSASIQIDPVSIHSLCCLFRPLSK